MPDLYDVIVRPVITEKSTDQLERTGVYTFIVAKGATKPEIAGAVEKLFDVTVRRVRTLRYRGKLRRMGRYRGRRPGWKKAVVTVAEGDAIEVFEGV
ncbi:MAG: 50S ribosomal protein L23 [Longimicrobiaceae bacterium]